MMPGDPETHLTEQRRKDGIPLDDAVWAELAKLADQYGVSLPDILPDQ